jgi:hypothetical protein
MLVGNPKGKRPLGRPRRRLEDISGMNVADIGWEDEDWTHLAQDMDQWRDLVNTAVNFGFHEKLGTS